MKPSFLIIIMGLMVWACSPAKKASKASVTLAKDSVEYEIWIIDPRFDQWYIINYSPAKDYSNEYYRSKNMIAVINWNDYYRSGKYSKIIDSYIDYQSSIDYGIEVNRKLFWYFKFVVETYNIYLFGNSSDITFP